MKFDSPSSRPRVKNIAGDSKRLWPLDLASVVLGGLVLFLILSKFGFDDPRWLYNATTYLIAVPCIALGLAFVLRTLSSRYLRKSIQLGFLFSVATHLLLLIFAINYMVFSAYQSVEIKGEKRERTPVRKTVPEYVFQTPKQSKKAPDWSEPVEAETASRVIPKEQRQLPPVERTAARLEVPKPRPVDPKPMQKYLMERAQPSSAQPIPADAPGKLARRTPQDPAPKPKPSPIDVPQADPSIARPVQALPGERQLTAQERSDTSRQAPRRPEQAKTPSPQTQRVQITSRLPAAASQSMSIDLPRVGDAGVARQRRARTVASSPAIVAGAAPAPVSVSIARRSDDASMTLRPTDVPAARSGERSGAQITTGEQPLYQVQAATVSPQGGSVVARRDVSTIAGSPQISLGTAMDAPGRSRSMNVAVGVAPLGAISPSDTIPSASFGERGSGQQQQLEDRLGNLDMRTRSGGSASSSNSVRLAPAGAAAMPLDVMAEPGPIGIGTIPSPRAGLIPGPAGPEIASMELPRRARPRLQIGGPASVAGTKIAAVESFSRRVMRTSGGTASSVPGLGGPETEEAIERGLSYLAGIQNENGSWSLQGHGNRVLLRSDTAATGLCLLAFQGAGYTHLQHQYAETVGKGLKFLLENQRTNGNLYRSEDPVSDRNVLFYSHGIAALALCEAYGMTQDPELREGAQASLTYIMATQHRTRGGWRYAPQVSSDTSVTGWMMMALKSGELSGLEVNQSAYDGIDKWLSLSSEEGSELDRYRYNPFAPDTPQQRHGKQPTPTMTAVGMLMRMYNGWRRDLPAMQSAAEYLLQSPPRLGDARRSYRDGYYWYYATQFMFHMGGDYWKRWNGYLNPLLLETQIKEGPDAGAWDPQTPVPDRWSIHAGKVYVTTMNLLNLEVYYRHLPIYEDVAAE